MPKELMIDPAETRARGFAEFTPIPIMGKVARKVPFYVPAETREVLLAEQSAPEGALGASPIPDAELHELAERLWRARGESVGVLCKLGVMQRAERILALGLGSILDPAVCGAAGWETGTVVLGIVGLIAAGTVGTAIYRTVWIANRLD